MKKGRLFGLAAGILLVSLMWNVSAYWEYRNYYDDCYLGDCEPRDYGLYVRIGEDSCYDYYDSPRYNYRYPNYYSGYYYTSGNYGCDDDELEYKQKLQRAIWDISEDYDNWQYNLWGKSSGEAYGDGNSQKASDWGNKEAYVASSPFREKNYYEPRYDSESGTWNWRY